MTVEHSAYTGIFAIQNNISKISAIGNDTNNDGEMSFDEYGVNKDLFNSIDSNGDGALTVSEISNAIINKMEEYQDKKETSAEKETESEETQLFSQILKSVNNENKSSESNLNSLNTDTLSKDSSENTLNTLLSSNIDSSNVTKMFLTALNSASETATVNITNSFNS